MLIYCRTLNASTSIKSWKICKTAQIKHRIERLPIKSCNRFSEAPISREIIIFIDLQRNYSLSKKWSQPSYNKPKQWKPTKDFKFPSPNKQQKPFDSHFLINPNGGFLENPRRKKNNSKNEGTLGKNHKWILTDLSIEPKRSQYRLNLTNPEWRRRQWWW